MLKKIIQDYEIQIPINNMEDVVKMLGGMVWNNYTNQGDYAKRTSNSFIICISEIKDSERRNYEIAQGICHLIINMGYLTKPELWERQDKYYFGSGNLSDIVASNIFAESLLMPKSEYVKICNQNTEGNAVNIKAIAKYFRVATAVAHSRGVRLGLLEDVYGN